MKINDILKTRIPFSVALLIIVAAATGTEQVFLQGMKEAKQANDASAIISLSSGSLGLYSWPSDIKEKVALTGASIPLMPGAKRLTFNDGALVRYRVSAPAAFVTDFYRQVLASQGWKTAAAVSSSAKLEKLTITYAENPLSEKTDITYAYAAANSAKVLGVKIAEADASAPAPAPAPTDQPPAPPSQPMPPSQPVPPQPPLPGTDGGQYQPQPPMNQPPMNQMEFSRPPMQPYPGDQGGNQTCQVNGAETSGPCQQYNNQGPMNQGGPNQGGQFNQGGPNQGGQFNQGGQMGGPGQQGPSEEEMKKNDERRFKDMKKGLSQFSSGAKMMKRNIAKIKIANAKCGVGMPEELDNALAQTDSLIEKINAAQTADELDQIIGDIQDVGSVMQDWGPRMGDLNRLCQMIKQADRDAKQFDRNVKRVEAQVKANKKVDLSGLLAEYKTAVDDQKKALADAKELAKTDPDSALTKLEDDFYGNMDNLGNLQMQIDAIINMTKGLRDITRELNTFASQIKTLAKKKVDTAAMQELLNTLKTQVAEIKDLINNKANVEEIISKVEEAFDTRQELQDALQEYDMIKTMPQINSGNSYNVKMNLPDAFIKNDNSGDNGGANDQGSTNSAPANSGANGQGL